MTGGEHGQETCVRSLVGGPFDGDRMRFFTDQQYIVVPAGPEGPDYRYNVAVDGRAYFERAFTESSSPDGEGAE